MKSAISSVSLVFGGLLIAASAVFAHPQPNNPEATTPATVYINSGANRQKFTLDVGSDGQLASIDIPPTDVTIAQIDSTVSVKCFFSRHLERKEKSIEYDVISEVIMSGGIHLPAYSTAERLFCYDSSTEEDEDRDDNFKVFVTTKGGDHGLVTLPLLDATFAAVNMNLDYSSLSKDVRGIAIVHHPRKRDPGWDKYKEVRCGLVSRRSRLTFGLQTGLRFSSTVDIDRMACSTENFRGRVTSIGKGTKHY